MSYKIYDKNGESITIGTYDLLCRYFDYKELREMIGQKTKKLTDIIDDSENPIDGQKLLTVIHASSDSLLKNDIYNEIFPVIAVADEKNTDARSIKIEKLEDFLTDIWDETDSIIDVVNQITCNGEIALTCEQVYELLLFCVLFSYVQCDPEDADVTLLKSYLDLNYPQIAQHMIKHQKEFEIFESPAMLPCFQKSSEQSSLRMELTIIHNKMDEPSLVKLEDCPLQRHLEPDEKILALTVNGAVVTFLPRICAAKDYVIYQESDSLVAVGHTKEQISLNNDNITFFSESKKYGLLIANSNGKFIDTQFRGKTPDKNVCWVCGDCEDYGFLFEDGTYEGHHSRTAWKNVLFFQQSAGNGIAVTADRKAIDRNGKEICENAAAVSCCGKRYIILRMDGSVITDQGEMSNLPSSVRNICADAYGYWIATDEALYRRGKNEAEYKVVLDEIERDNMGTSVYGLKMGGEILCIR